MKTWWKLWNSTGKTGFGAGLFNFLHRVFNMWKKSKPFTHCIAPVCGKLSASAKRRKKPAANRGSGAQMTRHFCKNSGEKEAGGGM